MFEGIGNVTAKYPTAPLVYPNEYKQFANDHQLELFFRLPPSDDTLIHRKLKRSPKNQEPIGQELFDEFRSFFEDNILSIINKPAPQKKTMTESEVFDYTDFTPQIMKGLVATNWIGCVGNEYDTNHVVAIWQARAWYDCLDNGFKGGNLQKEILEHILFEYAKFQEEFAQTYNDGISRVDFVANRSSHFPVVFVCEF